ncbi:MAG: hypothetical protein ACLTDR_12240 [Adlercreutzia equolifaciens]
MNTADRSLTQIDTALRRRFEFVEVSPDPSLIEPAILETDEGAIELRLILEAMNARIGALYDRDHAIGHSYLMGVDSFAELKNRFELKIIPLLQEYFYDDYSKIRLVLNDNLGYGRLRREGRPCRTVLGQSRHHRRAPRSRQEQKLASQPLHGHLRKCGDGHGERVVDSYAQSANSL